MPCVEPGDGLTCKGCENNSVDTIGTGTVIGIGSTFTLCTLLDAGNCTLVLFGLHRLACWHGFDGLYGIPAYDRNSIRNFLNSQLCPTTCCCRQT